MNNLKMHTLRKVLFAIMLQSIFFPLGFAQTTVKQGKPVPSNFCIREQEMELFRMVNEYRQQNNLPPVALSKSLCYVASLHARDLMLNNPDQGSCNFHSWSNRGSWIPFCYPRDENKKSSVWDKPREITKYPAKAYEIVYWENTQMVEDSIMMVWKTEEYFNSFLLNSGKWEGQNWNAIGISIFESYVCAWFGTANDPEGPAYVCGTKIEQPASKDSVKPAPVNKKPAAQQVSPGKMDPITDSTSVPPTQSGSWYIIVKTNLSPESAAKLAEELRIQDYPDARVFETNGKIRVSVFGPSDKATATKKLRDVKLRYKDAWLLKN
jgi:hypothetical protein